MILFHAIFSNGAFTQFQVKFISKRLQPNANTSYVVSINFKINYFKVSFLFKNGLQHSLPLKKHKGVWIEEMRILTFLRIISTV